MTDEEVDTIRRVKARLNTELMDAERSLAKHRANIQKRRERGQSVRTHDLEPSKSQKRLLKLLGLTVPERYQWAREMLSIAGYSGSGNPWDKDWRQVQYMGDQEFIHATKYETYVEQMRASHSKANAQYVARLAAQAVTRYVDETVQLAFGGPVDAEKPAPR